MLTCSRGFWDDRRCGARADFIYGCEVIPISWATDHKLLHEIVDSKHLEQKAVARAKILGEFPEITLKESVNRNLITGLQRIALDAKKAYAAGVTSHAAFLCSEAEVSAPSRAKPDHNCCRRASLRRSVRDHRDHRLCRFRTRLRLSQRAVASCRPRHFHERTRCERDKEYPFSSVLRPYRPQRIVPC